MPFPDEVFQHAPALKGRIKPPDQSRMRLTYARFEELDALALSEGWPPGWRMDHEAREENRRKVLAGRLDRDLWVFGYGSLIWDPAVYVTEIRLATLRGWRRRFVVAPGAALPATVKIVSARAHGHSHTAVVGREGRFEVGGFEEGTSKRLGIWAEGLAPAVLTDKRFAKGAPLELGTIRLRPGRSATVRVRDPQGRAVEGATVRLESTAWSAILWDRKTDAAGNVRIPAAPLGQLRATVRGPHTDSDSWFGHLPAGPAAGVETTVVIEHPVTLHATLIWAGQGDAPWAGEHGIAVSVAVHDDPTRPRYWHGRTAGNGSADILIRGCVPGDWQKAEIRVAVGKRWSSIRRILTIPRAKEPRDRFELGEIRVPPPGK